MDILTNLAEIAGVSSSYIDKVGNKHETSNEVRKFFLTAFFTDASETRRPNRVALFLFLMVANAEQISTAMVTVFIPPAVPTGEPPISIRIIDTAAEAFVRCSCGIVAKPAVLVVTDWKNDT